MKKLWSKFKALSRKKKMIIGAAFLVVATLLVFRLRGQVVEVSTWEVVRGDLAESVSASGEVAASELAEMAFPVSGKVAVLSVTEGTPVKKYATLAALDRVVLDTAYQQALNLNRRYQATVDNIHDQLKNKDTTETYAERDTRTTAEANNDYYYNALRAAEYNLKNAVLLAPFDGVVTNLLSGLAVGANVTLGVNVFSVVNPQSVYFNAEVSETEINRIKIGQPVKVSLDAFVEEVFTGKVEAISFGNYTSATGGNVYKVRVSLPENTDSRFRLGMKGGAEIILATHQNVVKVISEALVENGETYVWLVSEGKAKKQPLQLGVSSINETEVVEGLVEGNVVIINPSIKIQDGTRIKKK